MVDSYLKRIAELEQRCQDLETIIETTSEHADFIEVELEKRNELIRQVFGRYVTQEVVDEILSAPDGQTLIGAASPRLPSACRQRTSSAS